MDILVILNYLLLTILIVSGIGLVIIIYYEIFKGERKIVKYDYLKIILVVFALSLMFYAITYFKLN